MAAVTEIVRVAEGVEQLAVVSARNHVGQVGVEEVLVGSGALAEGVRAVLAEACPRWGVVVDRVQLSDLEDATHIPPAQALQGLQVGNHWWRSPEAHVKGAIGKPTDIFSFAIVVSLP